MTSNSQSRSQSRSATIHRQQLPMQLSLLTGFDLTPVDGAAHFLGFPHESYPFTHGSEFHSQFGYSQMQTSEMDGHSEAWRPMSSHRPVEEKIEIPPPKPKRTRKRKPKAPLDEATRLRKREEALDKNKRAAAKCRAKKKIEEDRQCEKLRALSAMNTNLHSEVRSLMQILENMKEWVVGHSSCTEVNMMEMNLVIENIQIMHRTILEDREKYILDRKTPGKLSFGEQGFERQGSEFSIDDEQIGDEDSNHYQTPPPFPTFSGADDFNMNNSQDLVQPTQSPFLKSSTGPAESKESPMFGTSVGSMCSPDTNFEPQFGGDNSLYVSPPAFDTGYGSYMYANELDVTSFGPMVDPMVTYLHTPMDGMNEMDVQSQTDSTYGSPASKHQIMQASEHSAAPNQKSTPLTRRDSAIGPEINSSPLIVGKHSNHGFPAVGTN